MEPSSSGTVTSAVPNVTTTEGLFKWNETTRMVSVETSVVLTTLLLVVRFLLDLLGPWQMRPGYLRFAVPMLVAMNHSMVHYTMGFMQLSAAKVNNYFQVWAVLLVTLQYSVKIGLPYSRSKKIPLLDLMSSLWAANLLRVQTFSRLRISLWLIWSLDAARIIFYFAASERAEAINQQNLRLTADYMSYEHEIAAAAGGGSHQLSADVAATPGREEAFTMDPYKYLVLGEDQVLKDLQVQDQKSRRIPAASQAHQEHAQRRKKKYRVRLDPGAHDKLITLDKIWKKVDAGGSGTLLIGGMADPSNHLKDVCLSFALYKLLRRRFYDLPLHEAGLPVQREKIRRIVFGYILSNAERAFRITATELSFLQDLFYSKHATMFATGFPFTNLELSVLLVAAVGYIADPVGDIPGRMGPQDSAASYSRIIHGVLITRIIIALIAVKELAEMYMYVFSQRTKVLMLCSSCAAGRCIGLVEAAMRAMLGRMTRGGSWSGEIHQHNILISRPVSLLGALRMWLLCHKLPKKIKMEACTEEAIFLSIKRLEENPERLGSYFRNAFGESDARLLSWAFDELEADTHRILVWHIATCLCEIRLASHDYADSLRPDSMRQTGPFFSEEEVLRAGARWQDYKTAASLSNYCSYLVQQALVPDNGLVALNVLGAVQREISTAIISLFSSRVRSMLDVYGNLDTIANYSEQPATSSHQEGKQPDEEAPPPGRTQPPRFKRRLWESRMRNSLTTKGAQLAQQLVRDHDYDTAALWEKLAAFWTGFLLQLAVSTRARKHGTFLAGRRELITHLWALLSHAGFLGRTSHGQQALDPEDRSAAQDANVPDQSNFVPIEF